jgi:hypothetical protein
MNKYKYIFNNQKNCMKNFKNFKTNPKMTQHQDPHKLSSNPPISFHSQLRLAALTLLYSHHDHHHHHSVIIINSNVGCECSKRGTNATTELTCGICERSSSSNNSSEMMIIAACQLQRPTIIATDRCALCGLSAVSLSTVAMAEMLHVSEREL